MIYIIGCGGVGSWLCPSLCLLTSPGEVIVIDGDKLEADNLNRQLFKPKQTGENKAKALADLYGCGYMDQWFNPGVISPGVTDWLFVCVDNNKARLAALQTCDDTGCRSIVAANETTSAEAYLYTSSMNGSLHDPRISNPDMLTDLSGDPQALAIGCTGQSQLENRQLVSANFMAAALAQHLFVCWELEYQKMTTLERRACRPHLPRKLVANMSKLETFKMQD